MAKKFTLAKFVSTRKVLTDKQEMIDFLDVYGSGFDPENMYPAIYVYADSYFIYQEKDGTFLCEIGNCCEKGTLAKCEAYLFDYAKDEL